MEPASRVPIISECAAFVAFEEARLQAVAESETAPSEAVELELVLAVTNFWSRQVSEVGDAVVPAIRENLADAGEPAATAWINEWLEQSEAGMQQWSARQEKLLARLGMEEAERIAEGPVTERLQAALDAAREMIIERARSAGLDVDALLDERAVAPETKLCPDCAEEIKAAAVKCRFCGYRYDS